MRQTAILFNVKPQSRKEKARALAVAALVAAALFTLLLGSAAAQDDAPVLHPGERAAGVIDSSIGDNWRVTVCAGDMVTVTLTSADFTPYLEATDAGDELVASSVAEDDLGAVAVLTATETTSYTLLAGPDRRSARGDYTLQMTTAQIDDDLIDLLDADNAVAAGEVVTGAVTRQAGESWLFYACAGEPVTITVTGDAAFAPYLEVLGADGEAVLAEAEGDADDGATIAGFKPDVTGPLLLVVTGVTSRDRGEYTLNMTTDSAGEPAAPPAPTSTPTRRATARPTVAALACTVQTNGLNMRSGPGIAYDPPLRALNAGTPLRALARNTAADWLQVEVQPVGTPGWVAARFVNCIGNVQTLPVGQTPQTPQPTATSNRPTTTATPTPTATTPAVVVVPPTATPTPPALVVIPGGGPTGDGWNVQITTGVGLATSEDGVAVFRRGMYVRLDIYSTPGNRRVEQVRFSVFDNDTSEDVHSQTEASAGYCSFGGGEPCNTLRLDRDARWPSTGIPVRNHSYSVDMEVTLDDGSTNFWNAQIRVDSPDLVETGGGQRPLYAEITETGPGSNSGFVEGALAFRVDAHDPTVGTNGGDGIDFVLMWVYGPDGREVRFHREGTSGYCIFQNGEPTCNVWVFADHDNRWPEGEPFQPGPHRLYAEVHASDSRVEVLERMIEIQ